MINVLSLFDGISVGYEALKSAKIPVSNYYASEIDGYAMKVARLNHPDMIHVGDITELDTSELPQIDLLIAGFPCQDLSSLGKGEGLQGERSGLFFHALRLFEKVKPKYWLFENVASMRDKDKMEISKLLGVEPIMICSSKLSAQTRKRLYWTNIPGVTQPKDKGIVLQDILTSGFADRKKAHTILTNQIPETETGLKRYLSKSIGQVSFREQYYAELDKKAKFKRFGAMQRVSDVLGHHPDYKRNNVFRHLNVNECEALQTLPKDYTAGISKSQRFKCLGNSFTCEVIVHILNHIPKEQR